MATKRLGLITEYLMSGTNYGDVPLGSNYFRKHPILKPLQYSSQRQTVLPSGLHVAAILFPRRTTQTDVREESNALHQISPWP